MLYANACADKLARLGARRHKISAPQAEGVTQILTTAMAVLNRATTIGMHLVLHHPRPSGGPEPPFVRAPALGRPSLVSLIIRSRHLLEDLGRGKQRCRRCLVVFPPRRRLRAWLSVPCPGAAGGPGSPHPSHSLVKQGPLLWCTRCGANGVRRYRRLARECAGALRGGHLAHQRRRLLSGSLPLGTAAAPESALDGLEVLGDT